MIVLPEPKISVREVGRQMGVSVNYAHRTAKRLGLRAEGRKPSLSPEQANRLAEAIKEQLAASGRDHSAA